MLFCKFESDVTSDGTQTLYISYTSAYKFESDVTSDGTQTSLHNLANSRQFESDVTSDGTQTEILYVNSLLYVSLLC